jgi:hypothetical protein
MSYNTQAVAALVEQAAALGLTIVSPRASAFLDSTSCAECGELEGDHHVTGICPIYGLAADGRRDYQNLVGFGGSSYTHPSPTTQKETP